MGYLFKKLTGEKTFRGKIMGNGIFALEKNGLYIEQENPDILKLE